MCLPLPEEANITEPALNLHELLTWGSEHIANFSDASEAVFLLGNTGAGKSTVTQIIAGNLSSLHAVHVVRRTYVIIDEIGMIGLPTTVSKTLVPNLVKKVDVTPPLPFYDFPGFDDTRDSNHDIAANFFMNQVTKKVTIAKLLFIVNYSSLIAGNEKSDFDKLAKHAVTFVKNIQKFKQSIALIVNKVSDYYGEVDDSEVIEEIVLFLQKYNETQTSYLEDLGNVQDKELILRKILFVDALLEQDPQGNFYKIWFIPTPEECGPLSESVVYTRTREKLTNLYGALDFTRIDTTTDFGFTLKPETDSYIENYTRVINNEISAMISNVTQDLSQKYFGTLADLRSSNNFNMTPLNEATQRNDVAFQIFKNDIDNLAKSNNSNPTEFFESFNTFSNSLGYSLSDHFENFMWQQETFLNFFDDVTQRRQERQVREWRIPFDQFEKNFADIRDWYEFCAGLEMTIYSPTAQLNIPTDVPSNVTCYKEWLDFLMTNNIFYVSQHIRNVGERLNQQELNILIELMNYALAPTDVSCFHNERTRSDTLTITGNLFQLGKFLPRISTLIATMCDYSVKEVYFLAGHTIFIDSSIEFLDMDVVLLAPNFVNTIKVQWNVLLKGKDADSHNSQTAAAGSDGRDSNWTGATGNNGCMGKPGKPGGSALMIATKLETSDKLVFHSKGGMGGMGQHGGNGGTGFSRNARHFTTYFPDDYDSFTYSAPAPPSPAVREYYYHYGMKGGNGGNGGNGGIAGSGGATGNFSVIELGRQDDNRFVEYEKSQVGGQGGNGGQGGIGGRAGKGFECSRTRNGSTLGRMTCGDRNPSASHGRTAGSNGTHGSSATSSACNESPEPARVVPEWEPILKYRMKFLYSIHPTTKLFLQQIDQSNKTSSFFSLKALAEELLALESHDRNDANIQRLVAMYDSLIQRLEIFAESHYGTSNLEERKIVKILLTSAFSSLMSLNGARTTSIVVDIAGYFSTIKNQMNTLVNKKALVSILESKQNFVERLQEKIHIAFNYIDNIVTPAVYEAGDDMNTIMEELKVQLVDLITDGKISAAELKAKLRRATALQGLLKFTKIFGFIGQLATPFIPGFEWNNTLETVFGELKENLNGNSDDIERLKALVEEAERLVADLEEKQKRFQDEFVPLIGNVTVYLKNIIEDLGKVQEIPGPQLGVTKWQAVSALKNCRIMLEEISGGSLKTFSMINAFDKIQDAMVLIIELYQMTEQYLDTQSLAQYIADVNSAQLGPISITDPQFVHTIHLYDQRLMENMLNVEIQKAMQAFKQWIFPFAKFYLPPVKYFVTNDMTENHLKLMEQLDDSLQLYKASVIPGHDSFIINLNFTSGARSSRPFYTWRNEIWSQNINSLLQGHRIDFNADIRHHGFTGWEAIKFKQIEINFKLNQAPPEMQENLDCALKYFGVRMTHSGMSNYRFQNEYFVMTGRNMTIQFNFEREPNGERRGTNEVYNKFKNGDYILSPYTLWTMQLFISVPPTNMVRSSCIDVQNPDFQMLTKYAPYIDLELVGMGTYVMGNEALAASGGNMELDMFYEPNVRFVNNHIP